MQFLFGPVKSRRLGNSLGVNLFSEKQCNLDCLYCEAGRTVRPLCVNEYYVESSSFKEELSLFLKNCSEELDYITFSGIGEPTLCENLDEFIEIIREVSQCKIGVITNGILLGNSKIIETLLKVDMVMPSLDSALKKSFQKINRPFSNIEIDKLVADIKQFGNLFKGEYFLEIMLLSGINTSASELKALKKASDYIASDKVFLNVLDRIPAYTESKKLTQVEKKNVKKIFSLKNEILL